MIDAIFNFRFLIFVIIIVFTLAMVYGYLDVEVEITWDKSKLRKIWYIIPGIIIGIVTYVLFKKYYI